MPGSTSCAAFFLPSWNKLSVPSGAKLKRVNAGCQVAVILPWRQLQQVPLVAVVVVIVHLVVDNFLDAPKGAAAGHSIPDFIFHVSEETFLGRIVPAISLPGHGLQKFTVPQLLEESAAGVVASLV